MSYSFFRLVFLIHHISICRLQSSLKIRYDSYQQQMRDLGNLSDLLREGVRKMATKTMNIRNAGGQAGFSSPKKHGLLGTVAATVVKWQERASMRHQLASLDKKYLNDMGIASHHAQDEISKPFWRA